MFISIGSVRTLRVFSWAYLRDIALAERAHSISLTSVSWFVCVCVCASENRQIYYLTCVCVFLACVGCLKHLHTGSEFITFCGCTMTVLEGQRSTPPPHNRKYERLKWWLSDDRRSNSRQHLTSLKCDFNTVQADKQAFKNSTGAEPGNQSKTTVLLI